jgi:radical SAM protein (TIGR01212 family)
MWFGKRYNNINAYLRKKFGKKVFKLSIDGGFSCPNRDGTLGTRGCLFCSEAGSGEFTPDRNLSITEQIKKQKEAIKKWDTDKYIAYFQNFTNTYASVDDLRKKYNEAIADAEVIGLAIATRPDCLSAEVLDLLEEFNQKTYLWVELGLQSIHEETAELINRGYTLKTFEKAFDALNKRNIETVIHLIFGLPFEDREMILASCRYVSKLKPTGIKIHSLYILNNSQMHEFYKREQFKIFSLREYINLVCDCIELLDEAIVIHRLTGDGPIDQVYQPEWSKNKIEVLNGIAM